MKVQFNRSGLVEALALLTSVVPSRTPKPILRCIRITAGSKEVHICATDLEVGLRIQVLEVQVDEPGEAVLDADRVSGIVRECIDEVLTFSMDGSTCQIAGSDNKFTVYGQDPEQFPSLAGFDGQPDIEVSLDQLQFGTKQCVFATAKESSRYAINGVLWEMKGKKLTMVATDGRRLARTRVTLMTAAGEEVAKQKTIVPAKTMALLEKIASHQNEVVGIKITGNQIVIRCGYVVISSNLVDGTFPKYEDIIPTDYTKKLNLNVEAVMRAVRQASLLASDESRGIKLSISDNNLIFSGRAPEAGAAEIHMNVEYQGEPIQIGFNPQFMNDALKVLHTPEFELELGQSDRPGVIKSGSEFLYVLMPINLA